jgi:hypothetical protein
MTKPAPPKLTKFPAAKQRRMDELLEKNAEGTITPTERSRLEHLVAEAEQLMVANAKLLAEFSKQESPKVPVSAVPLTVWVKAENAGR